MRDCPNCHAMQLLELPDDTSNFESWVCLNCAHYESNSDAFLLYPDFFRGLGRDILARFRLEAASYGLTEAEAQAWLNVEPRFTRQIVSSLDDRRKVTPLPDRREGTRASKTALSPH